MELCFLVPKSDCIRRKNIEGNYNSLRHLLPRQKAQFHSLGCRALYLFFSLNLKAPKSSRRKMLCMGLCMSVHACVCNTYILITHIHSAGRFCQFVQIGSSESQDNLPMSGDIFFYCHFWRGDAAASNA